jgi:hypothetical protein
MLLNAALAKKSVDRRHSFVGDSDARIIGYREP